MAANIVSEKRIPLYQQITLTLKQRIKMGQYKPGLSLPSLRTLSEEFKVSPGIVYCAIRDLEESGVVSTHHGKGVLVKGEVNCNETAMLFGLVQPFSKKMNFLQQVILYAEEAFSQCNNFMLVRSSNGSVPEEREIASHLIHNGVQGILLWPCDSNPNGQFFQELSHKIPVVLVARLLEGVNLPAAIGDDYLWGTDISNYMLAKRQRKRMLVIMDNIQISPYQEIIRGIQNEAVKLGRMADVTVVQLPLTDFIQKLNVADYSEVDSYVDYLIKHLETGGYDTIFCPQEEFLETTVVEPDLRDRFPNLLLASMTGPVLTRSRKYNEFGVVRWLGDFPQIIMTAGTILQKWVETRKRPEGVIKIPLPLLYEDKNITAK